MIEKSVDNCKNIPYTLTMFNQLERQTMKDFILDILTAVVIGLALCVGALAYFDVLTK